MNSMVYRLVVRLIFSTPETKLFMKLSGAMKFASVDKDGDEGQAKYLPVEGIKNMYCFWSI
jgi:hypothetical protein